MADEHAEDPENLDQPPDFFPYEDDELPEGEHELCKDLVRVEFDHIVVSETGDMRQHFVLLTDGRRHLMIVIGGFEAAAIGYGAEGIRTERPMTHDLLSRFVESLGGKVDRVVIDDLWNGTYYAKIYLQQGDKEIEIDARPSDAIAIAVRMDVPLYAIEGVLHD